MAQENSRLTARSVSFCLKWGEEVRLRGEIFFVRVQGKGT